MVSTRPSPRIETDKEDGVAGDAARVKLLTLLNVVAAKPPPSSSKRKTPEDRDWIAIAREAVKLSALAKANSPSKASEVAKESTSHTLDGFQVCEEDHGSSQKLSGTDAQPSSLDRYSYHFGPETSLLNADKIKVVQNEDGWKVASNQKVEGKRAVRFQPDCEPSPVSSSVITTMIPPAMQTYLNKLAIHRSRLLDTMKMYEDVWHTDVPYDDQRGNLRATASFWALQHVLKTRNHVLKNNEHLARMSEKNPQPKPNADVSSGDPNQKVPTKLQSSLPERETRDQGFTRPKVLVLLPFRSSALDWVRSIDAISSSTNLTMKGMARFEKEFSLPEGTIDKLESEDAELKYSMEHRMIFHGNVDDDFKIGIKLNRKEVRLYADFYQADIIIGSPVGLRKVIEKDGDADFLSSIEIAIVDQMDVIQMQNWDHLEFVFNHLNQIPNKPRDTDFSRVKPWYLNSHAHHLRQTILFSSLVSPEQNSLFRSLTNVAGKSIYFNQPEELRSGVLWKMRKGLQQTWLKFDHGQNELKEEDARFEFFKTKILGQLEQSALVKAGLGGIMIFVPTFFDFVRLENYMRSVDDMRYAAISEYSSTSEVTAARSAFFNRHVSYLLVTERFHFYHRYNLRGARNIVFYGPPLHQEYYVEFCNEYPFDKGDVDVGEVKVQVVFSCLDQPKVERIVGVEDCKRMVQDPATSFTFI